MYFRDLELENGWIFPYQASLPQSFSADLTFPFPDISEKTMKIKASYFPTHLFAEEGLETNLFALVRHVGGISTRNYPQGRHFDGHLVNEQKVGGVFRRNVAGQDYRNPDEIAKQKASIQKQYVFAKYHEHIINIILNQTSQNITFVVPYPKAMFLVAQQIHSSVMWYTSEAMESDRFEVLNCKGVPFSMRVRPVGGEKARVEWLGKVCS